MVATTTCLVAAALVMSVIEADASTFLGQGQQVAKEFVEQTLVSELASAADSVRIAAIQEELRPTFASLPKNEQGQLESSTVLYVLHRYFVQKHGWYVKGLDAAGGSSSSFSSADIITDLAPSYIQGLFEKHLSSRGLKLEELSVFVATLTDLIYSEGVNNLQTVYQKLKLPTSGSVSVANWDRAVRGSLAELAVGPGSRVTDKASVWTLEEEARGVLTEYDDLVMWVKDTRFAMDFAEHSRRNPFVKTPGVSFEQAGALMHELYHKFGSLTLNHECAKAKNLLMKSEIPGTGRVPLSRFYAVSVRENADQVHILHESADYIRSWGALDEANPSNPLVLISNYMSGPSNCMPFSDYFSVCCPDECENVLGSIERAIAGPLAEPRQLVEVVSRVAPRQSLSASLRSRLDDIASRHHGQVPLHGRLFMQWLHHVFPRECPYPHPIGTIDRLSQDDWILMHNLDSASASEGEMNQHMSRQSADHSSVEPLPWDDLEELVAMRTTHKVGGKAHNVRTFFMLVAIVTVALPLVRASVALLSRQPEGKEKEAIL